MEFEIENAANALGLTPKKPRVLLIDDDEAFLSLISSFFKDLGFITVTSPSAEDGLSALFADDLRFDLVISDLHLPSKNGIDLLLEAKAIDGKLPIVLMTASQSIESAVGALKKGAFDYITKPIHWGELEVISQRALQHSRLQRDLHHLKAALSAPKMGLILGSSPKIRELQALIERVSSSSASILITGESGSGKEMVARSIHSKSPRKGKPFIPVNCSAIPLPLLEAELFGHKKGAFTGAIESRVGLFEEAHGGTLFLDEIGDMPKALQTKILRALQERKIKRVGENEYRPVDVRIIAATNKDLRSAVRKGDFREDLYYRLNVIPIHVPPLRERKEDIPLLAHFFLKKFCALNEKALLGFDKSAVQKLKRMKWGGNVRELENSIERAVVLAHGPLIQETDISAEGSLDVDQELNQLFSELIPLKDLEKYYINYVLEKTSGKKEEASEILGINRKTLYRKEKEYDIR